MHQHKNRYIFTHNKKTYLSGVYILLTVYKLIQNFVLFLSMTRKLWRVINWTNNEMNVDQYDIFETKHVDGNKRDTIGINTKNEILPSAYFHKDNKIRIIDNIFIADIVVGTTRISVIQNGHWIDVTPQNKNSLRSKMIKCENNFFFKISNKPSCENGQCIDILFYVEDEANVSHNFKYCYMGAVIKCAYYMTKNTNNSVNCYVDAQCKQKEILMQSICHILRSSKTVLIHNCLYVTQYDILCFQFVNDYFLQLRRNIIEQFNSSNAGVQCMNASTIFDAMPELSRLILKDHFFHTFFNFIVYIRTCIRQ